MRVFFLCLVAVLSATSVANSQEIRDQKEAERVYRQSIKDQNFNKLYFDEAARCRGLLKEHKYPQAESSCRLSISLAEKLPKDRYLERQSGYIGVGIAQLWQKWPKEAISNFEKAMEIAKPILDDSDSETGDVYFLLGQAYHILPDVPTARSYYERAEKTYRTAFIEIDDDEIRWPYGSKIKRIVEAHYHLVRSAGLELEAEKLKARLEQVEKDFAKYLIE